MKMTSCSFSLPTARVASPPTAVAESSWHHYPTAGSNPVSDTRSLWDPSYDEHSWLTQYCYKGPINLLPRIQQWIDATYPGTGICISEYTYHAGKDGSGGSTADPHAAVVEAGERLPLGHE